VIPKLGQSLIHHLFPGVGVVPDKIVEVDPNVFPWHILHRTCGEIYVVRVRNEYQAGDQHDRLGLPGADDRTAVENLMHPNAGSGAGASHHLAACKPEAEAKNVAHKMRAMVIIGICVPKRTDAVNPLR